jgi:hypothetical protein
MKTTSYTVTTLVQINTRTNNDNKIIIKMYIALK